MITTRFAPSPNGPLHLGHAYSAVAAHDLALAKHGRFLLRIEDIDGPRSKTEFAELFRADLNWLGLEYEEVPAQSTRLDSYREAGQALREMGVLYPCICSRSQIARAAHAMGPDGPIYPGTCKQRALDSVRGCNWRLDVESALARTGALEWVDEFAGPQLARPQLLGDVVLVRKDLPASYHLAATLDDAADGITLVTRGMDLFVSTHIHRLLQALLGLPVPVWHHHPLLLGSDGQKLAKRRGSPSLAELRMSGINGRELSDQLRRAEFPADISLSTS